MKKIIEILVAFAFVFTIGYQFGQMMEDYSIKNTEIKLKIGGVYIYRTSCYRTIDPFSKKLQDTVRVDDIKEGFVLYSKLRRDTVEYQSSTRLSYFQDQIVETLKTK